MAFLGRTALMLCFSVMKLVKRHPCIVLMFCLVQVASDATAMNRNHLDNLAVLQLVPSSRVRIMVMVTVACFMFFSLLHVYGTMSRLSHATTWKNLAKVTYAPIILFCAEIPNTRPTLYTLPS